MAAGLVPVMTDVGLAGQIVKDRENGMVVSPGNRLQFSAAVKMLAGDPALRKRLAGAARRTVEDMKPHTWDEYLERYKISLRACIPDAQK